MTESGTVTRPPSTRSGRDIWLLTACQFLFYMGISVDLTLTGIVGMSMAPTLLLATLPLSVMTVVAMVCNFLAGALSTRFGHRAVLVAGALFAVAGGLISMRAIQSGDFAMLCAGTAVVGAYKATGGYFRYLAADRAPEGSRTRAISTVLCGGVVAAVAGPIAATSTSGLLGAEYAGAFLLVAVLAALVIPLVLMVGAAERKEHGHSVPPVPIRTALRTNDFLLALAVLGVAQGIMTLLMASGPIGTTHAHHSLSDSAFMIQLHMIGMFAPSLFSGKLCTAWGSRRTAAVGAAVLLAGAVVGATGTGMVQFTVSLLLVGVGWNLLYVAGSAFVVSCYPPGAGGRIQAVVEGTTGVVATIASFSASGVVTGLGWQGACAVAALPPLLLLVLTAWRRDAR